MARIRRVNVGLSVEAWTAASEVAKRTGATIREVVNACVLASAPHCKGAAARPVKPLTRKAAVAEVAKAVAKSDLACAKAVKAKTPVKSAKAAKAAKAKTPVKSAKAARKAMA